MYEDVNKDNIPDAINNVNNLVKQFADVLKNLDLSKDPYALRFVLMDINYAAVNIKQACDTVEWACKKQSRQNDR